MSNKSLKAAKKKKNDEFYTQYEDVENELKHYIKYFKDKIIYCNCDDPDKSAFVKYFLNHFEEFGLKKLVASCHIKDDKGKVLEYTIDNEKKYVLKGNGDFRSDECIELLKEADLIVTNPPFSLFREYIDQLYEYNKKFIIIGNMNAITYMNVFPHIKNNELKLGINKIYSFIVPDDNDYDKVYIDENGKKKIDMSNVCWYTTFGVRKNDQLQLTEVYDPDKYPKYDNYDAIEVSKTKNIPKDYDGLMGVPISFLFKYNPEQFEIIGFFGNGVSGTALGSTKTEIVMSNGDSRYWTGPTINKTPKYFRIIIKKNLTENFSLFKWLKALIRLTL